MNIFKRLKNIWKLGEEQKVSPFPTPHRIREIQDIRPKKKATIVELAEPIDLND